MQTPPNLQSRGQVGTKAKDSKVPMETTCHPMLLPPAGPGEIGRLGNYRVFRLLGQGGMAFVFHAEDIALHRPVALKVMKPDLARDADGCERFLREARLMASLRHDHLVTVYQAGQEGSVVYLAMELLQGETLDDRMNRIRIPPVSDALRLGREVASGLAVIHGKGLVHRDVKPGNIWLESPGERVKILDFGLARNLNDDTNLTRPGTIMGTPTFMSPEQARGEVVDARSDLFSLGSILYGLCTGITPFEAPSTMAVLTALAVNIPRPVHEINPGLPHALSALVTELLAKRPQDRPPSAETVVQRLRAIEASWSDPALESTSALATRVAIPVATLASPPPPSLSNLKGALSNVWGTSPRWIKASAAAALALFLLIAVLLLRGSKPSPSPESAARNSHKGTAVVNAKDPVAVEKMKVYLTEMKDKVVAQENYPFLEPPRPPGGFGPPPLDQTVRQKGVVAAHGIFMHPPHPLGGIASVSYKLDGKFSEFHAVVSLNDSSPGYNTPLVFAVYGNGNLLWKSTGVYLQSQAQTCDITFKNKVDILKIEVNCPGFSGAAHAVWIDPYVTTK